MMSAKDIQMEVDVGSEEDDIDDDDDDLCFPDHMTSAARNRSELGVDSAAGGLAFGNVEDKRAHHNFLERKRRDHIKDSFNDLRDSVPDMHGEKSSRAQILHKATEYISLMNDRIRDHSKDIDKLKQTNAKLEQEVEVLEKMKATKLKASGGSSS